MKADIKAKWVKELREGGHKQCQEVLHNGEGFCCLGVLEHFVMGTEIDEDDLVYSMNGRQRSLTEKRNTGIDLGSKNEIWLAQMNDWGGLTFAEIADYIEANL